jgi:hypothetical protein
VKKMFPAISLACTLLCLSFGPLNVLCSSYEKVPVKFSPHRGFYNAPITITLSPPSDWDVPANAVVVMQYTVSSAVAPPPQLPSFSSGQKYVSPFPLDKTAIVKAIAYQVDAKNQQTILKVSNLTTHSYVFIADVVRQGEMNQSQVNQYARESAVFMYRVPSVAINSQTLYPVETDRVDRPEQGEIEWINLQNTGSWRWREMVFLFVF